ncbi:MAG: hypothetical protein DME14_17195 [Candidatus Rokuibacteriota bacterium]|nr:MAG: hypothetical protein DME14_17195 [Candidatus Rokubacteria bacterium]
MGGDFLETLSVARLYCPGCEPNVDPVKEILDVRWCTAHRPKADGVDDAKISAYAYLGGSVEAGGAPNRAVCNFLHRPKTRRR